MVTKTIQAKHVDTEALLAFVACCNAGAVPRSDGTHRPRDATRWDIEAEFTDAPPKVLLAKCRTLVRQRRLTGCACGCRGDYSLPGWAPPESPITPQPALSAARAFGRLFNRLRGE